MGKSICDNIPALSERNRLFSIYLDLSPNKMVIH